MQDWCPAVSMSRADFLTRRRYINKMLIAPLRDYREQVLVHRIKTEAPSVADDAGDLPLLIDPSDLLAN